MPFSWRKLVLPSVLLKLVGRSPHTNVVSGGSNDFDESEARGGLSWDGEDILLGESAHQDRISPAYESVDTSANQHDQLQESSVYGIDVSAQKPWSGSTPAAKRADPVQLSASQATDTLPSRGHHRRTSSAASDISLSSVVSTTGAYTGFTQAGQYDLALDVILRGEFISEQQSKV
jgi:hypothetical protein